MERKGGKHRKSDRKTARGTMQVLAQLALMDKSITQSFHTTPDYPRVKCLERNLLSQVQEKDRIRQSENKMEWVLWLPGNLRHNKYTKNRLTMDVNTDKEIAFFGKTVATTHQCYLWCSYCYHYQGITSSSLSSQVYSYIIPVQTFWLANEKIICFSARWKVLPLICALTSAAAKTHTALLFNMENMCMVPCSQFMAG